MDTNKAISLLEGIMTEITVSGGYASTDSFSSLREVDAKVRETKMVLSGANGLPPNFISEMEADENFQANSRRVRLETLAGYIKNAVKFLKVGGVTTSKKPIIAPPDISKITAVMPGLKEVIEERWQEAQKCQHAKAYTAAIILMGSVLEALLLCRAHSSPSEAYQSSKAPKGRDSKTPAIQDWNLNTLIEVAVERGWLKTDRGKFGHALRESRNVVHPWVHATTRANFDEATCKTSWEVLKASVDDLLASCKKNY
jgi:hypothetical protein